MDAAIGVDVGVLTSKGMRLIVNSYCGEDQASEDVLESETPERANAQGRSREDAGEHSAGAARAVLGLNNSQKSHTREFYPWHKKS